MKTVDMLDPETGETLVAVVEGGQVTPHSKIIDVQAAALLRDRDDLLAALKAVTGQCSKSDRYIWAETNTNDEPFEDSDEVVAARALIARIEDGNGK